MTSKTKTQLNNLYGLPDGASRIKTMKWQKIGFPGIEVTLAEGLALADALPDGASHIKTMKWITDYKDPYGLRPSTPNKRYICKI